MKYKEELKTKRDYGDLFEIEDFRRFVKNGCFNDDDGSALAVISNNVESENHLVSEDYINIYKIPSDITHVWWFNK